MHSLGGTTSTLASSVSLGSALCGHQAQTGPAGSGMNPPLFWAHWLHDREGSHEHSQRPPLPFLQKPNRPETISQILCFSLLSVDFKKLKYRMLGKCHLNTLIFQLLAYNIEGFVFMTIRKDCKTFSFLALADTSHSYQFKSLDLHLAH